MIFFTNEDIFVLENFNYIYSRYIRDRSEDAIGLENGVVTFRQITVSRFMCRFLIPCVVIVNS